MIWQKHSIQFLEAILHTGFYTSVISYVLFWIVDLCVPGFVSRYFSVHVFLLSSIVFGILWGVKVKTYEEKPLLGFLSAILLGIVLSIVAWCIMYASFESQLLVSFLSLVTPITVFFFLKN